jgi:hypothetical protein
METLETGRQGDMETGGNFGGNCSGAPILRTFSEQESPDEAY